MAEPTPAVAVEQKKKEDEEEPDYYYAHRYRDEPYPADKEELETRRAQLAGRREAARAERPRDYARQPAGSARPGQVDFVDGDGRRYRILRDEVVDWDISAVPVYCRSTNQTRHRFRDVTQPGDTITLHAERSTWRRQFSNIKVDVVEIGYSPPRGSYSGRLVLDLSRTGLTTADLAASHDRPSRQGRSGRLHGRSAPVHRPGADDDDQSLQMARHDEYAIELRRKQRHARADREHSKRSGDDRSERVPASARPPQ